MSDRNEINIGLSFCIFCKRTRAMGGRAMHPDKSHFAQCREFGIKTVELLMLDRYIEPGDWKDIENVRRLAEEYGVRIHSIHGPSGLEVLDRENPQITAELAAACRKLEHMAWTLAVKPNE